MNKQDSLAFLQSCLDKLNDITEEDIRIFQNKYEEECETQLVHSEFQFIPPFQACNCDIDDMDIIDEAMVMLPQSSLSDEKKHTYSFIGQFNDNIQENNNAALAA